MKIIAKCFWFATCICTPALASEKIITVEEVKQHRSPDDCWIIINDSVYDVSSFIKKHEELCKEMKLTEVCGGNASSLWNDKEKGDKSHKRKSVLAFERSKIGSLVKK